VAQPEPGDGFVETQGRVVALFTAEATGLSVTDHGQVRVEVGLGIPGDRYATRRGHWSDPKWPDQELTLVEAEAAESLGIPAAALRRNVVTRGVRLTSLGGKVFRLGTALLEGVRHCDPCLHIEQHTGVPGLVKKLAQTGGLRARVLESGDISLGDVIWTLEPEMTEAPGLP